MQSDKTSNSSNGSAQRRYTARRLEILRAAGTTFRVRGFAETGMRDIAAAADISPASLYNYFAGKHEILFFCQDSSLDRMIAALDRTRSSRASAVEKLSAVIESHLRCVLDEVEGSAAHLLTATLPPDLQSRLVAKRDRYEEGVRQVIASGIRSGQLVACDPALAARAILGALNWSVRWFSPEGNLTATEIADEFGYYLIRGLATRPAALRRPSSGRKARRADRKRAPKAGRQHESTTQFSQVTQHGNRAR
jgi:AcrR family transcriptional regulator